MPWIDFKSGFALVGSLVVLVGSIVTPKNSMRSEDPEDQGGGSPIPEVPRNPEPARPSTFDTVLDHDMQVGKPRVPKGKPPTASA
jgi:hypothetical protein